MPPPRPSMTLPRNFQFHFQDGELPKTPEPHQTRAPGFLEPPGAPRPELPIKLARPRFPDFAGYHDIPVPTIEQPRPDQSAPFNAQPTSLLNSSYLAPHSDFQPFSPPKTPLSQVRPDESSHRDYFDTKSRGESISRPSTACSNFSDSSASSDLTLDSFPSLGGSPSPGSENNDPFGPKLTTSQESLVVSPAMDFASPPAVRARPQKRTVWTEEMDNHLWITFLQYLKDPTRTPFKLFPGSHPPLGVCHRVANESKRTWRTARGYYGQNTPTQLLALQRFGSPDIVPLSSGETTPTGVDVRKPALPWPRNSSTRRRLRLLCKRKPTLSAHYQRLMQNRSPSPFESSSSSTRFRSGGSPGLQKSDRSAFSTRDMNISLTSAIQSNNPLSELAIEPPTPRPRVEVPRSPVGRSDAHQRSHSLQLGIEAASTPATIRRLASPFRAPAQPQHSTWSHRQRPSTSHLGSATSMSQSPRLEPPAELHAPAPLSRSLKRRALLNLDDLGGVDDDVRDQLIQDVFGAPADSSHRRVRSRGFSLGDMTEGARRLANVFVPPSPNPKVVQPQAKLAGTRKPDCGPQPDLSNLFLAPPQSNIPPRLGSPFKPDDKPFATLPSSFRHAMQSSRDSSASSSFEQSLSFEERLGALAPGRVSKVSGAKSLGRSFAKHNPTFSHVLREQSDR